MVKEPPALRGPIEKECVLGLRLLNMVLLSVLFHFLDWSFSRPASPSYNDDCRPLNSIDGIIVLNNSAP